MNRKYFKNDRSREAGAPTLIDLLAEPCLRLGKCILMVAVWACAIGNVDAQITLAGWDFNGQNSAATNPLSANTTASNITVGGLTLGSGLTSSSTANTFGGTNWTQGGDASAAATNSDLLSFTLTANAGYTISLNGISAYNIRRSGTGPTSFLWQYQIGSAAWSDIGTTISVSGTANSGNSQSAITLSGIASLQGVSSSSTIGLRLLGWGATNTNGTGFLNNSTAGNDFIITGSVASATAFTTWTGTGSAGTWSNGTAGQFAGNYANDLSNTVTFNGTGGTVNATGPVQAGSLVFNSDAYILAGAVQLGTGSITTTGAITTNITASISGSGSSGLAKSGAGTLILSGSNSFTGDTTIAAGTVTIGNDNAFGSTGNITFSGGTLQYANGITTDLSSRIKNSTSAIIVDTNGNNVNFANAIDSTNSGGLTKSGAGTLTLNGNNTLTQALQVNAGTLSIATGSNLTINTSAASTISGTLSGGGNLTKLSTGSLTISNNNSGYSGVTTISAGTLQIGHDNALGTGSLKLGVSGTTASITFTSTDATDRTISNALTTFAGSSWNTTFGSAGTGNLTFSNSTGVTLGSTRTFTVNNSRTTFANAFTGASDGITKAGTGTLILAGNNSYTGATTINAGILQIGNGGTTGALSTSSAITVNGTLSFNRSDDITQGTHFSSSAISGTGSLVQNGTGNLTLNAANTYTGNTTINTGTVIIGNANAAGSGTIFQTNASSLIKFATTGTLTNNMSLYNVLATQNVTLSGAVTTSNATFEVDPGDNLTISGNISGSGGVTKTGNGTLTLSGNNSYSSATVINAGTLNAASTGAFGGNSTVRVNGGTLLVSANSSINGMNITLNSTSTTVAALSFTSNYTGNIGALTLSANSILDMGEDLSVVAAFASIANLNDYILKVYNWDGASLWGGGTGDDNDRLYFGSGVSGNLGNISFYSGFGSGFLGTGFDLGFQDGFAHQIIPVPEPETWVTGALLLLGAGIWGWRRSQKTQQAGFVSKSTQKLPSRAAFIANKEFL